MTDAFAFSETKSLFTPQPSLKALDARGVATPPGVTLRARKDSDTADLFALFNERSFLDNASTHGRFETIDEFETWLDGLAPAGRYEVVAQVGAKVIAFGGLYAFPELMSHCGSFVLGVREAWQNQNVGAAILHTLLVTAEVMAGLDKIHLTVFTHNIAAIKLYIRFGFEVEGLLRQFIRRENESIDAYSMALFFDTPKAERRIA